MAPSTVCVYLIGFLALVIATSRSSAGGDMVMEEEELQGLFEVLDALLEDPLWAQVHPQPCTDTPWPGVQCEIGEDTAIFHVTKIHIGPDIVTPPCKTSASLSHSLHKLPYLKTLSIFNCFVSSSPVILSPTLFGALTSLEHLTLDFNPALSGDIPSSFAKVASLKILTLSQNNLQGNIPRGIGGLVNLEQLDLSYNHLSGEIPEDIGELKSLTILDLSFNSLEGHVPSSLGQLQLLQKVDLGSNKLIGSISPDLGKLNRLVLLDLSCNFINGPMPVTLSGLKQLQYLILDYNPINTGMPMFIETLNRLTTISLSRCGLTGQIPNFFSSLKNLTALSLDNNSLTGTIPSSLGSLPNLDQLNVSHNQLSGQLLLPEEFIDRLGKRLDVRGNSGLCTSNDIYQKKNISVYLETPACFSTIGYGKNKTCLEGTDNKRCPPGEFKGLQEFHGKKSSKASLGQDPILVSYAFVLSFLCLLM